MSKRMIGIVVAIVALVSSPSGAFAKDQGTTAKKKSYQSYQHQARTAKAKKQAGSPWANERGWANQARGKFVFGAKNTLLGWTELFTEPYEASKQGRNVASGVGEGLLHSVVDTAGGVAHLLTFPVTKFDLPLPEGGV